MASFYQFVVKLPEDFASDLPNLSPALEESLTNFQVQIPDWSDLNVNKIDEIHVGIGERIQRCFNQEWRRKSNNEEFKYFYQLEKASDKHHIHMMVETTGVKSMVLGRYVNQIKKTLVDWVYGGAEPQFEEDWFHVCKTSPVGGTNRVYSQSFIPTYLLPKKQEELQWAWTNIKKYIKAALSERVRDEIVEEHKVELAAREEAGEFQSTPKVRNKTAETYMKLVQWLVENGITSERQWIQEHQESYLSYNASSSNRSQIKAAMDNASKIMSLTKKASDYLIGKCVPENICNNRIYKILKLNNYHVEYVASILLGWSRGEFGKRNTIWFFGPATTGKTNIAEAIAHAVPFYGCVNWTNENFPFNDCVDKMVIWWEEGKMTSKVVESAKAILGGSRVRVDQKCKSSVQIDPTPVVITSNTDMTVVVDGNSTTFEHRQPLEDRIFKFFLEERLPDDFGKVTKEEVQQFFAWAEQNRVKVEPCFTVPKSMSGHALKRPASSCEGEDIKRAKSAQPSVADSLLIQADAGARGSPPTDWRPERWHSRYFERCDFHGQREAIIEQFCKYCEYLNRGRAYCFPHENVRCQICHARAPWDNNVELEDVNKEQ
nr:MAG: Rep [Canine parvovirus]